MSKTSHECENVFAAVFAHYLHSFDVWNEILNRSHEWHQCRPTLSAQAHLCKRKPCRSRNELRFIGIDCNVLTASSRVTMNGSVQNNWPLYVMDRLSLWTGSGQWKLIGSHSGLLKMTVMYRWPLWTSGRYGRFYCISNSNTNYHSPPQNRNMIQFRLHVPHILHIMHPIHMWWEGSFIDSVLIVAAILLIDITCHARERAMNKNMRWRHYDIWRLSIHKSTDNLKGIWIGAVESYQHTRLICGM